MKKTKTFWLRIIPFDFACDILDEHEKKIKIPSDLISKLGKILQMTILHMTRIQHFMTYIITVSIVLSEKWFLIKNRNIPMCKCANVWMLKDFKTCKGANVPMWKCKNAKKQKCENVQMYKCANVKMCKCENEQMCKCSNVQKFKCPNVQMCKRSNVWPRKYFHSACHWHRVNQ